MGVVSTDIAQAEIEKWLAYKKISESKKESAKESIDTLISAIEDGSLVLSENHSLVQTLGFPVEDKDGKPAISKLEYKPRLTVGAVHAHLQGVKANDLHGMIVAYVAALTSNPKELIKKLDLQDYGIAQAIAIFFV